MVIFKDIKKIGRIRTPFYYYDMDLLESTLKLFKELLDEYGYTGHFALKSNDRKRILETVRKYGLGADCVSGDEVSLALNCGFPSDSIVFAGVGKSDREIVTALKSGIFCFNCESIPELEVIDSLASELRVTANVALRINPEVDAHTLSNISTGRKEDKFGISLASINKAIDKMNKLGIKGKECTPFLLKEITEITGGDSLETNIKLILNNAKVGAEIAKEYVKL